MSGLAWIGLPAALPTLRAATRGHCGYVDPGISQCPRDAGAVYRAAFRQTPEGWRMSHFLSGD